MVDILNNLKNFLEGSYYQTVWEDFSEQEVFINDLNNSCSGISFDSVSELLDLFNDFVHFIEKKLL